MAALNCATIFSIYQKHHYPVVVGPGPAFLIPKNKLKLSRSSSHGTAAAAAASSSEGAQRGGEVTEDDDPPSYSGSSPSARTQLDLLEQLRSTGSPVGGYESDDNDTGLTIRDQLAQLVGDRDDDFSIPLGKNINKVTPKFLTVAQKRNIRRQAYLNEVSQRNDTVFFATIGAFVVFPPIIILGIAIANGYVQLFP